MIALNIFSIFVDSLFPPFKQTFPPSRSCPVCCAVTGDCRFAVPGQWGMLWSQRVFFLRSLRWPLEAQHFRRVFLRDEIDEREKKDIFLFQYSSKFSLLFLRQEFQKFDDHPTVCHEVLLFLLQHT